MYRDARGERFEGNWNRGQWDDAPVYRDDYRNRYAPARRPASRTPDARPWR